MSSDRTGVAGVLYEGGEDEEGLYIRYAYKTHMTFWLIEVKRQHDPHLEWLHNSCYSIRWSEKRLRSSEYYQLFDQAISLCFRICVYQFAWTQSGSK